MFMFASLFLGFFLSLYALIFYTVGVERVMCDAFRDFSCGGVLLMLCLKHLFQQPSL